ncbi:MAG: hypothetical protein ABJG47_08615 [Ekhidna sp.]
MAHNQLAEKLDQVSEQELGFEFDDAEVWTKLEHRLDNRKAYTFWWVAAACLLVGFIFLPLSILKETTLEKSTTITQVEKTEKSLPGNEEVKIADANSIQKEKTVAINFPGLRKKGLEPPETIEISSQKLLLEPIAVSKPKKKYKPAFAAEDISVIQASLEGPSIEKRKSITVRAQLQSFPDQVKSNQKVLKIKLYEKH